MDELGIENVHLMKDFYDDIDRVVSDVGMGIESKIPGLWPIRHIAVNKAHSINFLSLRRWPSENRKDSISFILSKKETKDRVFVNMVANELADFILAVFGSVDGFVTTNAPAGNSVKSDFHLATLLTQETAKLLGIKYLKAFLDYPKKTKCVRNIKDKKNTILRDGVEEKLGKYKGIILIDDAATTRTTIETCVGLLAGFLVIPIVWVYNDKVGSGE